jgi:hypothetical protein
MERMHLGKLPVRRLMQAMGCLLVGLCCGCTVVESDHPLSDAKTHTIDDRVLGEWKSVDPQTKEDAGNTAEQRKIVVRKVGHDRYEAVSEEKGKPASFYLTKLGDGRYLSIENIDDDASGGYLLLEYKFVGDDWHVYMLHPDLTANAIQHGKIEGTVRHAEMQEDDDPNEPREVREVRLTASTHHLRAFFATPAGQALFHTAEPVLILQRATK